MRENGTFAGSNEIEAISNMLNLKINRANNTLNFTEIFVPDENVGIIASEIEIIYIKENEHYNYLSNITNYPLTEHTQTKSNINDSTNVIKQSKNQSSIDHKIIMNNDITSKTTFTIDKFLNSEKLEISKL